MKMRVRLRLQDGSLKEIEAREVTEHFANDSCKRNGWDKGSPIWHDLARVRGAHPNFLKSHAHEMYPGSTAIELVM